MPMSEDSLKWNKMLDMWVAGETPSPYNELIHYYNEINSGGHWKYIDDLSESGALKEEIKGLKKILPRVHKRNLKKALRAYPKTLKDNEKADEIIEECDSFYYDNEQIIDTILQKYANTLKL
ncbi:MAG: hypothetical protein IJ033_00025 [Clostridia bacterium]|nr:hypothetical protein [Clostridia bacterium]